MEYVLLDEKIEPEARLKLLALASARARCETLMQVLEFISIAKKKGLGLEVIENIVIEWLAEADTIYQEIVCKEELFNFVMGRVRLAERVMKAKARAKA